MKGEKLELSDRFIFDTLKIMKKHPRTAHLFTFPYASSTTVRQAMFISRMYHGINTPFPEKPYNLSCKRLRKFLKVLREPPSL